MDKARLDEICDGANPTIGEWADVLSLACDGLTFRMLNEQGHVAEFTSDNAWSLEHPATCRIEARLLDCPVNVAINALNKNPFGAPGRYRVIVGDAGVLEGWWLPNPQEVDQHPTGFAIDSVDYPKEGRP